MQSMQTTIYMFVSSSVKIGEREMTKMMRRIPDEKPSFQSFSLPLVVISRAIPPKNATVSLFSDLPSICKVSSKAIQFQRTYSEKSTKLAYDNNIIINLL